MGLDIYTRELTENAITSRQSPAQIANAQNSELHKWLLFQAAKLRFVMHQKLTDTIYRF